MGALLDEKNAAQRPSRRQERPARRRWEEGQNSSLYVTSMRRSSSKDGHLMGTACGPGPAHTQQAGRWPDHAHRGGGIPAWRLPTCPALTVEPLNAKEALPRARASKPLPTGRLCEPRSDIQGQDGQGAPGKQDACEGHLGLVSPHPLVELGARDSPRDEACSWEGPSAERPRARMERLHHASIPRANKVSRKSVSPGNAEPRWLGTCLSPPWYPVL